MGKTLNLVTLSGPIRIRIAASEPVHVQLASAPARIRVLGTPGPAGRQGDAGPPGPIGPQGSLDAQAILDGGNF